MAVSKNGRGKARKSKSSGKKKTAKRTISLRSAEVREVARSLTTLALVRLKQEGSLSVRQRENLRRALSDAGEALGWSETVAMTEDPLTAAAKDAKSLLRKGSQAMKKEVADELARKKQEAKTLEGVVESVQELADDPKTDFPTEITYHHTARDAAQGLVTKTETVTVADAKEARAAAESIEKSMGKWGRLREQMLDELRGKQQRLGTISDDLSQFVESWQGLLREVLLTIT